MCAQGGSKHARGALRSLVSGDAVRRGRECVPASCLPRAGHIALERDTGAARPKGSCPAACRGSCSEAASSVPRWRSSPARGTVVPPVAPMSLQGLPLHGPWACNWACKALHLKFEALLLLNKVKFCTVLLDLLGRKALHTQGHAETSLNWPMYCTVMDGGVDIKMPGSMRLSPPTTNPETKNRIDSPSSHLFPNPSKTLMTHNEQVFPA